MNNAEAKSAQGATPPFRKQGGRVLTFGSAYFMSESPGKRVEKNGFLVINGGDFGAPSLLRVPLSIPADSYGPFFKALQQAVS